MLWLKKLFLFVLTNWVKIQLYIKPIVLNLNIYLMNNGQIAQKAFLLEYWILI